MENFHLITVKYLPATNTRGSRVKLTSTRFEQSVIIGYDHAKNNIEDIAVDYLKQNGHVIAGKADGAVICEEDKDHCFKPLKKQV